MEHIRVVVSLRNETNFYIGILRLSQDRHSMISCWCYNVLIFSYSSGSPKMRQPTVKRSLRTLGSVAEAGKELYADLQNVYASPALVIQQ